MREDSSGGWLKWNLDSSASTASLSHGPGASTGPGVKMRALTKYIRYHSASGISYGILEGDTVRELRGDLFADGGPRETGVTLKLSSVKLLYPCAPCNVLAVGLNYRSHIGSRTVPSNPEIFYKPATCLQSPDGPIVIPRDATNVHYEGELVAVLGRQLRNASLDEARAAIFGVTCGNDVSEREWQHGS